MSYKNLVFPENSTFLVTGGAGFIGSKALDVDIEPIYDPDRKGDIKHSNADISKARKLLGYDPEYSFERGINEAIEWYRENL